MILKCRCGSYCCFELENRDVVSKNFSQNTENMSELFFAG
jgi:hypothetical protein